MDNKQQKKQTSPDSAALHQIANQLTDADDVFITTRYGPREDGSKYRSIIIQIDKDAKLRVGSDIRLPEVDFEEKYDSWEQEF